jgi:hypothetical protein
MRSWFFGRKAHLISMSLLSLLFCCEMISSRILFFYFQLVFSVLKHNCFLKVAHFKTDSNDLNANCHFSLKTTTLLIRSKLISALGSVLFIIANLRWNINFYCQDSTFYYVTLVRLAVHWRRLNFVIALTNANFARWYYINTKLCNVRIYQITSLFFSC